MRQRYHIRLNLNHLDGVMDVVLREDWDRYQLEKQDAYRATYKQEHPDADVSAMHFGEIIMGPTLYEFDIEAYDQRQAQRIAYLLAREYGEAHLAEIKRSS